MPVEITYQNLHELLHLSTTREKLHVLVSDHDFNWNHVNTRLRNTNSPFHDSAASSLVKDARTIQHVLHTFVIPKVGDQIHITPILSLTTYYIMANRDFNAADLLIRYIEHLTNIRDPDHRRKPDLALGHIIAHFLPYPSQYSPPSNLWRKRKNLFLILFLSSNNHSSISWFNGLISGRSAAARLGYSLDRGAVFLPTLVLSFTTTTSFLSGEFGRERESCEGEFVRAFIKVAPNKDSIIFFNHHPWLLIGSTKLFTSIRSKFSGFTTRVKKDSRFSAFFRRKKKDLRFSASPGSVDRFCKDFFALFWEQKESHLLAAEIMISTNHPV
ncbi:hypothetical protein M5K25_002566 [Dendrobium thyrsiflorum]|uniref:Uncharacterized protein n=1 Tax=Dendrobium thyrsiflorum TaxID=117978 RepID=A0ABD0VNK5_DENTH